jgi:hypothetical protein
LKRLYPEGKWEEPSKAPSGHWNDIQNQRKFFDDLASKLNVKQPDDWYDVQTRTVVKEGGSFINRLYKGSLIQGMI